ncbi:MAG: hydroxymethylpyrimidine/phosphomethylpyrimidine kinase [Flavobacteriaceae bacterium]|nr:hydroxymethylpyrimidine/phosphomethylpyrimidine kinase [Flavobacteriaceae bacterium]
MKKRPNILTIAGLDPSSGAGLTADIKTFEMLKCYGLSICSGNTVQNDVMLTSCHWTSLEIMKEQITILFQRFEIDYVKIGIVENWAVVNELIEQLVTKNSDIKIVLDPVLKSSSNFNFHSEENRNSFEEVLSKIYLLTPNYNEINDLFPEKSLEETIAFIRSKTNLVLKGGHRDEDIGKDELYLKYGQQFTLNPKMRYSSEKHGSGCVFASAVTSYLALGFPLLKATYRAKRYTEKRLSSNKSLLAYHR